MQSLKKIHAWAQMKVPLWTKLYTGVLMPIEEDVCDTTKLLRWRNETWWWNKYVTRCNHSQAQSLLSMKCFMATAHRHPLTLSSALPDVWCTKQTSWSMRALAAFEESECRCYRRQANEKWCWGNVNERGGKAEGEGWTLWKASQHWVRLYNWAPVKNCC